MHKNTKLLFLFRSLCIWRVKSLEREVALDGDVNIIRFEDTRILGGKYGKQNKQ